MKLGALSTLLVAASAFVGSALAVAPFPGPRSSNLHSGKAPLPRRVPGLEKYLAEHGSPSSELVGAPAVHGSKRSPSHHDRRTNHHYGSAPLLPRRKHHKVHTFTQPVDHFNKSNTATFEQRFWYSLEHYKPPSERPNNHKLPVYIFDGGETDASAYTGYLDSGITWLLANETGGILIVLEHRYFGESYPKRSEIWPVSDEWDQDGYRFLSVEQALEDSAKLIKELKLDGVDEDISGTDNATPYIYYGASYPGARSAWMRHNYPDLVWGSIASSAVTLAQDVYPEYFYVVSRGSQAYCSQALQRAIRSFDSVAKPVFALQQGHSVSNPEKVKKDRQALIDVFVGSNQTLHDIRDLANAFSSPLGYFQEQYWIPGQNQPWDDVCNAVTGESPSITRQAKQLQAQGKKLGLDLDLTIYLLGAFNGAQDVGPCVRSLTPTLGSQAGEHCLGTSSKNVAPGSGSPSDNSWSWLVCSTFGYNMVAPNTPHPDGGIISGPKVISELIDYSYTSAACREGNLFPPGKVYHLPHRPETQRVNQWGKLAIADDRLAIIGGQWDPWRSVTPVSEDFAYGGDRLDTLERPFKLIPDCWHGCDSLSYSNNQSYFNTEPKRIHRIHEEALLWTKHWMNQYWDQHK